MCRFFPILLAVSLVGLAVPCAHADDAPPGQELHDLRQAVLQQAKQIELLTEQIGRLTRAIELQRMPESPVPAAASHTDEYG